MLKNASLPHDGRRTQAKVDDVTRSCALGFRRLEESSKSCSSPSARAIFTHTRTASIYCLAHRDALSVWRHVFGANLEAANVFSAWIWREKTSSILSLNFQYVFWIFYIPFLLIHGKSIFVNVNNLQEIIV